MTDPEIEKRIADLLSGTSYTLAHFERDHPHFGNMTVRIRKGSVEYRFVSDRGDIFLNSSLVFVRTHHAAGEDDSPGYLIKAIEQLVR